MKEKLIASCGLHVISRIFARRGVNRQDSLVSDQLKSSVSSAFLTQTMSVRVGKTFVVINDLLMNIHCKCVRITAML